MSRYFPKSFEPFGVYPLAKMFLYFDILRKLLKVHFKKYAQNYDEKVIY